MDVPKTEIEETEIHDEEVKEEIVNKEEIKEEKEDVEDEEVKDEVKEEKEEEKEEIKEVEEEEEIKEEIKKEEDGVKKETEPEKDEEIKEEVKEEEIKEPEKEEIKEPEPEEKKETKEENEDRKDEKKSKKKRKSKKTKSKSMENTEPAEHATEESENQGTPEQKKSEKKKHKSARRDEDLEEPEEQKPIPKVEESKAQRVLLKYSRIVSTEAMPYLWYREAGDCSGDVICKESSDISTLLKESYLYVYREKHSEAGNDSNNDDAVTSKKYEFKWGKFVKDALSLVSPYDTIQLNNTYNTINENDHFNILAETDVQDAGTVTINPHRDVVLDHKAQENTNNNDTDGKEEVEDGEVERLTLYGIKLCNEKDGHENTIYVYMNTQEEQAEWLSFLRDRIVTLNDPKYLAAQEDENMLSMEDSDEEEEEEENDDIAKDEKERRRREANRRSTTMAVLHNIAINGMATDKSKPMIESLNEQIQAKYAHDAVVSTTFAVSSGNLAKSTLYPESKMAACTEQDVMYVVPYILALSKFKIHVFLKESPCVFSYKMSFHYLAIKSISVKLAKYITFSINNGCSVRFQVNSTISLLREIYRALKLIAPQSAWPEVVTELESRNDFWSWESEYDDDKVDASDDDDDLIIIGAPSSTQGLQERLPSQSSDSTKDVKEEEEDDDEESCESEEFIVKGKREEEEDDDDDDKKGEDEHCTGHVFNPLDIYLSECYLNGITPRQSFIDYISKAFADNNRELDITACLDPTERGGRVDYNELFAFLRSDKYFRGVSITGVMPTDGLAAFARVAGANGTLTRAVLRNVDIEEKRSVQLCDSLRGAEKFSHLCSLDLSGSPLKSSGMKAFVRWVAGLSHGLVSLNLSSCDISSRGFQALFAAFKENPTASKTLQSLIVTNNKLGDAGSAALASWVASLPKGPIRLSTLGLGKCKLALGCLEPLGRLSFDYLDISDTQISIKLTPNSSPAVSAALSILRSTKGPSTLVMNRCVFADRPFFEAFTGSFLKGGPERKVEASELQVKGVAPALIPILLMQPVSMDNDGVGIVRMGISGIPLKPKSMNVLSSALALADTVRSLDISSPSKDALAAEKTDDWVFEIAGFASSVKTLVELNISGGYGVNVVTALLENHSRELAGIRSLDVSGNGLGEKGMNAVLKFIETNNSIYRIACDNNGVTLATLSAIRNALYKNDSSSLFAIELISDFTAESQRVAADKEKTRILKELMKDINDRLRANYARVAASETILPEVAIYKPRPDYMDYSVFTSYDENVRNSPPVDSWK